MFQTLLALIPASIQPITDLVAHILAVIGASAAAAAWFPQASTGWQGIVRKVLDFVGQNYGNATNASVVPPAAK